MENQVTQAVRQTMFKLCKGAGAGKFAIVQTLVDWFKNLRRLVASYFSKVAIQEVMH